MLIKRDYYLKKNYRHAKVLKELLLDFIQYRNYDY